MITEKDIETLPKDPPSFQRVEYPYCNNVHMPKLYPIIAFAGSRGSGKTFTACRWLKNFEENTYYHPKSNEPVGVRHILFSPTYEANPIFNSLDKLDSDDIHTDYSDSKLIEVIEDVKAEKEQTEQWHKYKKVYKKFLKTPEDRIHMMKMEDLALLYEYNFIEPHECEPRYPNGVITNLILDDLLSSSAFSQKKNNKFVSLCLNSRHYGINVVIIGQYAKGFNKSLRANVSIWCLFRFRSEKILEDMYQDVSNDMDYKTFLEMYNHATKEDFCCLTCDSSVPKEYKYKINFHKVLSISNKSKDGGSDNED